MSDSFPSVDDITMELATVLDEYSAVDCYRMKKNMPMQLRSKKTLSYKSILDSNYPGTSCTDSKYKLPDSIDMDYIDMLSGKNIYSSKKEEARVPISMKSFEKLCYQPELTENQKQAIEKAKREEEAANYGTEEDMERLLQRGEGEDYQHGETGCSPCCFDFIKSEPKEDEKSQEFDCGTIEDSEEEKDVNYVLMNGSKQFSDAAEESPVSNERVESSLQILLHEKVKKDESILNNDSDPKLNPMEITPHQEVKNEEPKKQNSKEEKPSNKKKKSIFGRMFSRKEKNKTRTKV